jgi:hypothetical protein
MQGLWALSIGLNNPEVTGGLVPAATRPRLLDAGYLV